MAQRGLTLLCHLLMVGAFDIIKLKKLVPGVSPCTRFLIATVARISKSKIAKAARANQTCLSFAESRWHSTKSTARGLLGISSLFDYCCYASY